MSVEAPGCGVGGWTYATCAGGCGCGAGGAVSVFTPGAGAASGAWGWPSGGAEAGHAGGQLHSLPTGAPPPRGPQAST
eukprot:5271761-Prymnesium_polylepis.1